MATRQKLKPMRSIWHSLLWKEWHEHKWKLAMLVLLVCTAATTFRPSSLAMLPVVVMTTLCCYSIFGVFLGMSTAAGENGRGMMPFLRTLPTSTLKAAAIKLGMSWATLVIPILIVVGLASAYLRWHAIDAVALAEIVGSSLGPEHLSPWGIQNWLLGMGLSGVLAVTSLLVWTAAVGANRADEIRAGAISFLTMVSVWFCLGMLDYWAAKWNSPSLERSVRLLMAAAPGGPAFPETSQYRHWQSSLLIVIAVVLLAHACLVAWYLRRFGRDTTRSAQTLSGAKACKTDQLAPPRRSQLTAIIWKQVRETGPLAIMAVAAVLGMAGLAHWINRANPTSGSPGQILAGITLSVGFLVTVVAGMGVFLEDVKPKVGLFWRSRPVDTTQWFFVKFFTGLVVLFVTFGALIALAFALEERGQLLDRNHAGLQVTLLALIFPLIYTLSMASYCLSRHPIVAVVVALGIFISGATIYKEVFAPSAHWAVPVAVLLLAQVAATAIAWLAVRNNWGWTR